MALAHDNRDKHNQAQLKESAKKKPNARSNTDKAPSPKPKSKTENKQKQNTKRKKQQEKNAEYKKNTPHKGRNPKVSPANMTEEELLARSVLQARQLEEARNKANNKAKRQHALTQKEIDQRNLCLEAKEKAIRPDNKTLRTIFAEAFENQCLTKRVEVMGIFGTTSELTERDLENLFYEDDFENISYLPHKQFFVQVIEKWVFEHNRELKLHRTYRFDPKRNGTKRISQVIAEEMMNDKGKPRKYRARLALDVPFGRWLSFVAENPKYKFAKSYAQAIEAVSDYTTRTYRYPKEQRHFILDIGPTNSGKTYSGMQELIAAESGVYLGPLRLLAMEAADTMNQAGVRCSMLTGEEANILEDARHIASTVEMLNKDARYEVAVIDECQMITDPERGYAWSAAIASINAQTIHLCLAPEAEELIISILDNTDEDYEVVYHERLVPLHIANTARYPKDIKPGDAVVVFSRKQVQAKAAELEKRGLKTSMVYGALPYDVRKEEVRKFAEGETDVVVATDAIGMGMNLPIKRVVFVEGEKYDGHVTRSLTINEIKQIAGRAGRFGKYDTGYATGSEASITKAVAYALENDAPQVQEIRLDMPEQIKRLPLPLCQIMRAWQMIELDFPYVKRNLGPEISLARRIEDLPNDFVLNAVEIPFKSGDLYVPLDDMWEKAVRQAFSGEKVKIVLYNVTDADSLQRLEDAAKVADLAYGLAKRYGTQDDMERVDNERDRISQLMIDRLRDDKSKKHCTWCGRPMSATSSHNMHDECYEEFRAKKYGYDLYW